MASNKLKINREAPLRSQNTGKPMRRFLLMLHIALILTATYFPLCAPFATAATANTRFGTTNSPPLYGTDGCYNDVFMLANFATSYNGTTFTLTSDGYPGLAGQSVPLSFEMSGGYPSGLYQFFGRGKFTIGCSHDDSFVPGSFAYDAATDITTALVKITTPAPPPGNPDTVYGAPPGPVPGFWVTPTDQNDLPNDFHLMRPDVPAWYAGWTEHNSIFGKQYLKGLAPYCCIRFIGWMFEQPTLVTGPFGSTIGLPNNYGVTDWASRPSPTYFSASARGICYENMIEMCNELNCDMWICIPVYAVGPTPTDWCANMAALIKAKLKPNLHVYYEIWDEVWNYAYPYWIGTAQVQSWAAANPNVTSLFASEHWLEPGGETAELLMRAQKVFSQTLGTDRSRAILAGQFVNNIYCSGGLQYIAKYYGPPAKLIWGIAGAPYVVLSSTDSPSTPVLTSMQDELNQTIVPLIKQNVALANQYGVKFCCYELGQGLIPTAASPYSIEEPAQYDPGMATIYYNLAAALKTAGAELCCWLDFCAPDGGGGFWGTLTDIREVDTAPTVKYQAQVNIAASCKCVAAAPRPLTKAQEKALEKARAAAAKAKAEAAKKAKEKHK